MKKLLLTAMLLVLAALALLAASPDYALDREAEVRAFRGHYLEANGIPYVWEDGTQYRLLLAPKAALDSLGIELIPGDSLYVEGVPLKSGILVTRLAPDAENGRDWMLRDDNLGDNYYDELTTTKVNPDKCIGCKLCVSNCPVGAISMVNGKAVIDTGRCVECGICIDGSGRWKGCPVGAICK